MAVALTPSAVFARDFRVLRPLNEGGMGSVYIVEQISTGSHRALKLMHPELVQDPRFRQRFEQEARVGARIQSEHVVQVLAAGIDDATGHPYLVMELLEGEDLAAALGRRGSLSPQEVGFIFAQLCHALAAAHAAGVVHRDLKPENIFLAAAHREGSTFTVKVLDFGIAKVVAEAKTTATAAIGTPQWMAPEQTMPNPHIGPQTDVWALGLIAFRMLTGRHYWIASNAESAGTAALMREILIEPVVSASERAAHLGVGHLLPPGFDDWFKRCVEREVERRFSDAAELRAALAPLLSGLTPPPPRAQATVPGAPLPTAQVAVLSAPPPVPGPPLPMPSVTPRAKRSGAPVGLFLGGVAVVLLGLVGVVGLTMRSAHDRSECENNAATVTSTNAAKTAAACKRACSSKGGEACVNHGEIVRRFKLGDDYAEVSRSAFEKACSSDLDRGCTRAAALLERTDPAKAVELYTKACDHGDAPACSGLGALREQGAGGERDRTRALALYEKACKGGDALGCAYEGFMLADGRGIKPDEAKAVELTTGAMPGLESSCDRGGAKECVALGALLGEADAVKAARVEQQACDAGEPAGCSNLGVRTLLGQGVFKDAKRGAALLKQGCDGGEPSACTNLGLLDAKAKLTLRREVRGVTVFKLACGGVFNVGCAGWGMTLDTPSELPQDLPAAVMLSAKACDAGELIACVNLGAFHQYAVGTERSRERASELFKKACDSGDAGGCGELGAMYATGRGVAFDGKQALALLTQACAWGERDACVTAGDLKVSGTGVPKAVEEGVGIFKTFCEAHDLAMACNAYAGAMAQGRGVPKDGAKATTLLKLVCEGKKDRPYPGGCVTLGVLYENGVGVTKDFGAASKYYQTACERGAIAGCTGMARLYADGFGVPRDSAKALSLVNDGCKAGDAGACDQLGFFHATGKAGLVANGPEAIKHFQVACDDASWGSCTNIGLLYLLGIGKTPMNRAKAAEYLELACSHGEDRACQKVKENAL